MNWVFTKSAQFTATSVSATTFSPLQQPYYFYDSYSPPSPPSSDTGFNLNSKVSPTILLIIIILAIIFFVSGLLHLLVRFLTRPQTRGDLSESDNVTAFQGQLQQLFHLHDAGVDQSFIDTLPVFNYKAIIGLKNPFDCAVCLCEFETEDKLRLLPQCSHAFHMECIDTWLLSHSTCPLCRASLLSSEYASSYNCSPFVLVLESGSQSSRELDHNNGCNITANDSEHGSVRVELPGGNEKVVAVKLGKFRNVEQVTGSTSDASNSNVDTRRCFSMGSFAYVMEDNTLLQVPIRAAPAKKSSTKRTAMSESGCDSKREFTAFDLSRISEISNMSENAVGRSKRESFSMSKIWMRKQITPSESSSRRAFSFRFATRSTSNADEDLKGKNGVARTISEMGISRCGCGESNNGVGSEFGYVDEEDQSCGSLENDMKTPSFARRTLNWIVGRQNKVVHSSCTTQSNPC